jgi:chemotaxis protein MotA
VDLATLIGLIGVLVVMGVAIAIGSGGPDLFVNLPGLLIVLGGTLMATLIKFPFGEIMRAFKVGLKVFAARSEDPEKLIREAVELAGIARKQGLLALEGHPAANAFLKKGIGLLVDGHPPQLVRKILASDINQMIQRHDRGARIFRAIGEVAPAMGMIGTLIGLVQMLASMDDPSSIGPAMAVALLTTLYGAVIANAIALPIANKLAIRSSEERTIKRLVLESISAIQEGLNPMVMEELLNTFLPENRRNGNGGDESGAPAKGAAQAKT